MLASTLVGLDEKTAAPRQGDFVVVYTFLKVVVQLMITRDHLAFSEIVDKLENERLLKPYMDEERARPNQIVFAAYGWLSKSSIRESFNKD
jgi:hypothetical protein